MFKNVKYELGRLIANVFLPKGLYCFNYHRIGDADKTDYDPNVFSCDENNFDGHIEYLKTHFTLISLEDLPTILNEGIQKKRYALITFDDGYIDNYSKAFPILVRHKVAATFFLATNFIENAEVPWWDKIAFLIRNSSVEEVRLNNWPESVVICKKNIATSIRKVLDFVKVNNGSKIEDILIELEHKVRPTAELPSNQSLFMTWDMAREMSRSGMSFGSQTCSHRIMSHLTEKEQDDEAKISKEIIDKELNKSIEAFAYPVGGKDSFTLNTIQIIKKYYNISFSFIAGINTSKSLNKFTIERISVDGNCSATQLSNNLLKLLVRKILKKIGNKNAV